MIFCQECWQGGRHLTEYRINEHATMHGSVKLLNSSHLWDLNLRLPLTERVLCQLS